MPPTAAAIRSVLMNHVISVRAVGSPVSPFSNQLNRFAAQEPDSEIGPKPASNRFSGTCRGQYSLVLWAHQS